MFYLYGISEEIVDEAYEGFVLRDDYIVLATFDKNKDAEEYIEWSKVDKDRPAYVGCKFGSWKDGRIFKKESVLCGYQGAEIREYKELPHNPKT